MPLHCTNISLTFLSALLVHHVLPTCATGTLRKPVEDNLNKSPVLDCGARQLAYEYALKVQPWLDAATRIQVWDALELGVQCGGKPPSLRATESTNTLPEVTSNSSLAFSGTKLHVATTGDDKLGDGTEATPFRSVHQALQKLRSMHTVGSRAIVLRAGVHFLGAAGTLLLTHRDSGTQFMSYPGEMAWLSGGISLSNARWEQVHHPSTVNSSIWKTFLHPVRRFSVRSLFTESSHERLTWARYPNMDVEREMWGYGSPGLASRSINSNKVVEWFKPPPGRPPKFTVIDLTNPRNPSGVVKNNSAMQEYNLFNDGSGGVCSTVWSGNYSYWCGNRSGGGWAEVDSECATTGRLQIPVGMQWNSTLTRLSKWADPRGSWVHAWHSQTWAMHMFEIASFNTTARTMTFSPGGGSQGGRNWCRCDQCGYAAGLWSDDGNWCNHYGKDSPGNDTRLIGGNWIVEGVFEELDKPGEFWYNTTSGELWVWPNKTAAGPPPALVLPVLASMVSIQGASNITFTNLGFRDTVSTYDKRWQAPSGGDWSFHRSAAFEMSNTHNIVIHNCTFRRLDGNAVLLSGGNRDTKISRSRFEWIGQNAAAGWGDTDAWDGRSGQQPERTSVTESFFHDVGLFQKQSSAWFQAKTAQTTLRGNIMFNVPRAAINFNDGFGGGNTVTGNLIFNSCRESGDHGPINTWDRQPFLTNIGSSIGGSPSFNPAVTEIAFNFIWANYGASQGVDNDDGSSFYWIHNNVFYDADGFKMDYGGHGSVFERNLVITKTFRGECINLGPFLRGLGDSYKHNVCWMLAKLPAAKDFVGEVDKCDPEYLELAHNTYGTIAGNATMKCGSSAIPINELARSGKIEKQSSGRSLPSDGEIVADMRQRLGLKEHALFDWGPALYI